MTNLERTTRLVRGLGVAAVALFLIVGGVLGADALFRGPSAASSQTPASVLPADASVTPEPTETAEATETPEPSETPEATETAEPTETPEPAKTPKARQTPEPTETPEPAKTPKARQTPEPTETPEADETPEASPDDHGGDSGHRGRGGGSSETPEPTDEHDD
jgi:outer membrane biosynthesis protein TonB